MGTDRTAAELIDADNPVSRRAALALAAGAGFAALAGGGASAQPPAPGSRGRTGTGAPPARTLDSMFQEASVRYGVPRDVLAAVGYNESLLDNHGGQPSQSHGFGIMHLADNPTNRTLTEAAGLTGLDVQTLRTDDDANILGAAAVLAARADQLRVARDANGDVARWHPVIAGYPGLADRTTAALYAQGVYLTLEHGVQANGVVIAPRPVPPQFSRIELIATQTTLPQLAFGASLRPGSAAAAPDPQPQAGARPRVIWSPAHRGNYRVAQRPRSHPIRYIVVHVTQGSYAGAVSWFKNPRARVSAHYTVRSRDGQITQSVRDSHVAWHAGNRSYNNWSIGIEHEGWVSDPRWFTEAMYRSSARLTRYLCQRYGIPMTRSRIIGHHEVPRATHTDPGRHWDWAKYLRYVNARQ